MSIRSAVLGVVVGATVATAVGVAYASIPDSSGVIHACWQNVSGSTKPVKLLDSTQNATCPTGWKALSWNQTGPPGPTPAFGYLTINNGATDMAHTKVSSVTQLDPSVLSYGWCVDLSFTPITAAASSELGNGAALEVQLRGQQPTLPGRDLLDKYCPAGTSAIVYYGSAHERVWVQFWG